MALLRRNLTEVRNLLQANGVARLGDEANDEFCLASKVPGRSKRVRTERGRIKALMLPICFSLFFLMLVFGAQSASAQSVWSMGYYAPQTIGGLPALSTIEWSALTHVVYAGGNPNSDGSITLSPNFATLAPALITAAHANNVKVLYSVLSGNFNGAYSSQNSLSTLITNIMSTVNAYGFDGVDLDYEESWNAGLITTLVSSLRSNLGSKIITATTNDSQVAWGNGSTPACSSPSAGWTAAQVGYLDRLNVIAYDMGNPSPYNPVSWFNGPLYTPSGQYLWSADYMVKAEENCGVSPAKIGIGVPFYGDLISANTAPYQVQGSGGTFTQLGYSTIATSYNISAATYDSTAHAAWLTVNGSSYVNWNSPQSMTDMVSYVKSNGLGGWIIWVLGWDYLPGNTPQDPLLNAIGNAMGPAPPTSLSISVN